MFVLPVLSITRLSFARSLSSLFSSLLFLCIASRILFGYLVVYTPAVALFVVSFDSLSDVLLFSYYGYNGYTCHYILMFKSFIISS